MIETILATVLSSALILKNPSLSSTPQTPHISFTRVLPEKNYVSYIVGKNDTLKTISQIYYDSPDYWTNLWNDNPSIIDPDNLPEGHMLSVNFEKTTKPAALHSDLSAKEDQLNQKKNQEYLQSIGYVSSSTIASVQTSTPIVSQRTTTANAASTISEEAITYLGNCEAGMDSTKNTGNGYYGAFQFSYGTWKSMNTGYDRADIAPMDVQKIAVKQLLQRSSVFSQFPGCANKMRSAGLI